MHWYGSNSRDLPWRRRTDPYAVWVAEIMLQQTRAAVVIPYWERWMETLPDLHDLAQADSGLLHKLWEGLGYYSRVRNMHRAARRILEDFDGEFPRDFESILSLPGVGRYTAGAIASIAFGEARPAVDGNVTRVLCRLDGIRECIRHADVRRLLRRRAEALVRAAVGMSPANPCGDLNQSLIELGATVCLPRNPDCSRCPLADGCRALRQGCTGSIPDRGKPPAVTPRRCVALVIRFQGRYLVRQRETGGRNALLWEFPQKEIGERDPQGRSWLEERWRLKPEDLCYWGEIRHAITTSRIRLGVYATRYPPGIGPSLSGHRWMSVEEFDTHAFTGAHRRIVQWIREGRETASPA